MKENNISRIKQIVSWEHNDRYAIMYNMSDYCTYPKDDFCPFIEYRDFIFRVLTSDGKVITNAVGIGESAELKEDVLIRKEDHLLRLISSLSIDDARDMVGGWLNYFKDESRTMVEAKRAALAAINEIKNQAPYFSVDDDALEYLND